MEIILNFTEFCPFLISTSRLEQLAFRNLIFGLRKHPFTIRLVERTNPNMEQTTPNSCENSSRCIHRREIRTILAALVALA